MSSVNDFVKSQQELLSQGIDNINLNDNNGNNSFEQPPNVSKVNSNSRKKRGFHAFHDLSSHDSFQHFEPQIDPNAAASAIGMFPPAPALNQNIHSPHVNSSPQFQSQQQRGHQRQISRNEVVTNVQNVDNYPNDTFNINQSSVSDDLSIAGIRNQMNEIYKEKTFLSFQDVHPPLAGTQYKAIDQSNAIPQFARTTMYSIPFSEELRDKTKIPLGLCLRPFADSIAAEIPPMNVPQVLIKEGEVVPRCRRCRAYLNPAMQHDGNSMICNICGFKSPVPVEYASTVNMHGVRDDYNIRPELHTGVVDYIVPKEYKLEENDELLPLHRIFLIDLSYSSYSSKLIEITCLAIRMSLYKEDGTSNLPEGTRIAIIGFDNNLHFFDLSSGTQKTTVSIVTDLNDPFIPFNEGLFVDPVESSTIIETTLTTIEQENRSLAPEPSLFPALQISNLLLKEVGGGQIISVLSTIPSFGPGALVLKNDKGKSSSDYTKEILTPDNKFYENLKSEFVKNNVGLNLLVASNTNVDLINLATLATNTGGSVRQWLPFNINRDEITFIYEMKKMVQDIAGYQCQLKVRCSHGLQVSKYYGPFNTCEGSSTPNIPIVSGDTSIVCDIVYDSKLDINKDAHFQAALLYTSKDGIRKVRVVNSILSITQKIANVFDFSDQDSIVKVLLKNSIERVKTSNMVALRSTLKMQCSDIMASYKHYIGKNNTLPTQLVLPQSLRTLPMVILSILKTIGFKEKTTIPDKRVSSLIDLSQFNLTKLSTYLYPELYCIHSLEDDEFTYNEETGIMNLGKTISLNMTNLEFGGAYLAFNGERIIIWLHNDVNKLLLKDLFGVEVNSIDELFETPFISQLPVLDTYISYQVRNMCDYLAKHFNGLEKQSIEICRFRKDPNEIEFQTMFVEDKSFDMTPSYSDFLKEMHKYIQSKSNSLTESKDGTTHSDSDLISRSHGIF